MKRKNDLVIYNNQEQNAILLIKELNLSRKWYYKRRNQGKSAQEAFDDCLNAKLKPNKNYKITIVAKDNHISPKKIYKEIEQGKNINEVIAQNTKEQEIKREEQDYLHRIGLPQEYENIHDFCIKNGLDYQLVVKELKNGQSFTNALNTPRKLKRSQLIYFKIQLKSLCLKLNLNYQEVRRKAINMEITDALTSNLFNQCFSTNLGNGSSKMWLLYQQYLKEPSTITDETLLATFKMFQEKNKILNRYISYYQFLSYLPIKKLIDLPLDERVRYILLNIKDCHLTLMELYYILDFKNGLMQDFTYLFDGQSDLWLYQPSYSLTKL